MTDRLYLDNAATSFPKPSEVTRAMTDYATRLGASPGRGAYAESIESARILDRARRSLADLLGFDHPDHVVFTLNCSDALNLAIHGLLGPMLRADERVHAVTTAMDHNSVLRPFNALTQRGPFQQTRVACDPGTGLVDADDVRRAIRQDTALVAIAHASNVTGVLQPLDEIARVCDDAGVPLLVDAAQSAGHVPIDMRSLGDRVMLAVPGHKGLMGPLGTGALLTPPALVSQVEAVRQGGTGSWSEDDHQPESMPDRYEPGSHNTPGIAGLAAGLDWLAARGIDSLRAHEHELITAFIEAFDREAAPLGWRLLGPRDADRRVAVFAVTHTDIRPEEAALIMESGFGLLGRAGLHCAPHAHAAMGTTDSGGALRLSFGAFNTLDDARRAADALADLARESVGHATARA